MRRQLTGICLAAMAVLALLVSGARADDVRAWPLFYRNTDPESREVRTEVLWPIYVRQVGDGYAANQLLSFPQRYPTQYPEQFYVLWPLSGVRAGRGHDTWLFPFLWSGADASGSERHHALFPAFYYSREGDERTLNLALLQHNRWSPHRRAHYLWPLFWGSLSQYETSSSDSLGVLPLFWYNRDDSRHGGRTSQSRAGGALLVSWWTRHQSASTTPSGVTACASDGLFPVFYRYAYSNAWLSGAETHTCERDRLWLLPYGQNHRVNRTTRGAASGESSVRSQHILFPLYWDWRVAETRREEKGRLLFPLWWQSEERRDNEVWASARFFVPIGAHLFKKNEYETENLLGPVFTRTASNPRGDFVRYDAFFPFLSWTAGRTRSGGRVFPLAGWGSERGAYDNLWYAFPFGWRCETQQGADYNQRRPQFWALHELESRPAVSRIDCQSGPRRTVAFYPFFWSQRRADAQHSGVLPFYSQNVGRGGPDVSRETWLPLLLGRYESREHNGQRTGTWARQDYLLSALAHASGNDRALWRLFPLFSYNRSGEHRAVSSFVLPFSRETSRNSDDPDARYSSKLSIPFSFLPLIRTASSGNGTNSGHRESWFFPLYKASADRTAEGSSRKLSVLWPLWNGEWQNDETRIRGLGGAVNFYERDANGFVEQRLLYRFFTRRTRSWVAEHEVMPFYAQSSREDGAASWSFLGGLLGGGRDTSRHYMRLLYFKIPTSTVAPADGATRMEARKVHADLALNYLRHGRHDRAAIEFTLAGAAREDDIEFQLAAGEAYLNAKAEAIGQELRSSIPTSLAPLAGKSGYCDVPAVRKNLRGLAIQRFEAAMQLGADRPETLRKIACAHYDMGGLATALEKLSESDRLRPCLATGMERLSAAVSLCRSRLGEKGPAPEEGAAQVRAILAELQTRYPDSPSLGLMEAGLPGAGEPLDAFRTMGYGDRYGQSATGTSTVRRLALFERGATLVPGAEERAWLADPKARAGRFSFSTALGAGFQRSPTLIHAWRAIAILNMQMQERLGKKRYAEAEEFAPRILSLLPVACAACAEPGENTEAKRYDYQDPVRRTMNNLHTLYVTGQDKPLAYISYAKELAARLCEHQRMAVEQELERVRFEQQYLKAWRITGDVAGRRVNQVYTGKFLERYVGLDSILGRPDRCTVTAACVVTSPQERPAVLWLGFDHALTVELNGTVVFGPKARKIAVRDEFRVPVVLQPGENRLRLTVTDDTLAYGFFARLSSEAGGLMEDVTIMPAPEPPKTRSDADGADRR